jgi:hypothetical protein
MADNTAVGKIRINAWDAQMLESSENLESGVPYGHGNVLITRQPGNIPSRATYVIETAAGGDYELSISYASKNDPAPRPVIVTINGVQITNLACAGYTGGWGLGNQVVSKIGIVQLRTGENAIMLSNGGPFPHIAFLELDGPRSY